MSYTMEDFITGEIAVTFKNVVERDAFLTECEKAGLRWNSGTRDGKKATEITPRIENAIRFTTVFGSDRLVCCLQDWHNDLGYIVVPFASFNFPPHQELHITSDGLTTHAVCKVDGKIVGRGEATCSPLDKYDFETGGWLAMARALDETATEEPAKVEPKYREVERIANVGEKIKVVDAENSFGYYRNGDVLTVRSSHFVYVIVCEHKNCLHHHEYVVLEEIQ